jgi:subtilisin family serine protease/subtilisin-like proprotein convertase family protein
MKTNFLKTGATITVAVSLLWPSVSSASTDQSSIVAIPSASGSTPYEIALNEVYVPGQGIKQVGQMADVNSLSELVRSLITTAHETVYLVLYRQDAPKTETNRGILTDDIVIQANAAGAAAAGQTEGVQSVQALSAAPGFYKVKVTDPTKTIPTSKRLEKIPGIKSSEPQIATQKYPRAVPDDTLFNLQWHLQNTGQFGGTAGVDLNVTTVWDSVTGQGVTIGIVDDGLQGSHEDLTTNYISAVSRDFNDDDPDPSPGPGDFHGTSCAGVAAGRGFNALGICGVAPSAGLAGLRLIAAPTTDATEAEALGYQSQAIDIKSNSWGPHDGTGYNGIGSATNAALLDAVTNGRSGRGTVFLWAGGNGGQLGDNSNLDGYSNSIYAIAVSAVGDTGVQAAYSEPGANLSVCAPSNGGFQGITTTDIMGADGYNNSQVTTGEPSDLNYTSAFGGTSSACPAVAGVVALMLQAKPTLTWRSVQNILIRTARQNDATDADWITNRGGIHFNHKYGAGLVDAAAAVAATATAPNLGTLITETYTATGLPLPIADADPTGVTVTIPVTSNAIRSIEKVVVEVSVTHSYRGDLAVTVTAPSGTASTLATPTGDSANNLNAWPFMTVRNWGERASGNWTVKVADLVGIGVGTLDAVTLKIYGTARSSSFSGGANPNAPTDGVVTVTSHLDSYIRNVTGVVKLFGLAEFPNYSNIAYVEYQHTTFGGRTGTETPPSGEPGAPMDFPWRRASGTANWSISEGLDQGLNTFKIRAVASDGTKSAGQVIQFLVSDPR